MSEAEEVKNILTQCFNEVDKDKSGFIEQKELEALVKTFFANPGSPKQGQVSAEEVSKQCKEFLAAVDKDGDQKISLSEFIQFFSA